VMAQTVGRRGIQLYPWSNIIAVRRDGQLLLLRRPFCLSTYHGCHTPIATYHLYLARELAGQVCGDHPQCPLCCGR